LGAFKVESGKLVSNEVPEKKHKLGVVAQHYGSQELSQMQKWAKTRLRIFLLQYFFQTTTK